eukprot:scaffold442_cov268-Pinguiococcus_pyrenoidosus.AAC.53
MPFILLERQFCSARLQELGASTPASDEVRQRLRLTQARKLIHRSTNCHRAASLSELEEPRAALMISSARHSEMVLMLRKLASRAPVVRR